MVHAGKYMTEDRLKIQTTHKLNTTQKKQTTQNKTTMVQSPFTTLVYETWRADSTMLPSPYGTERMRNKSKVISDDSDDWHGMTHSAVHTSHLKSLRFSA